MKDIFWIDGEPSAKLAIVLRPRGGDWLEDEMKSIHRGGIGRSTVTAACVLIHSGWRPELALAAIEKACGCVAPDTPEQRDWILNYETRP